MWFIIFWTLLKLFIGTMTQIFLNFFLTGRIFFSFDLLEISSLFNILIFYHIILSHVKFSSWWSTRGCWPCGLASIEANFHKFVKWVFLAKTKRDKLKEIVKVFISKDPIIDTLELTIHIDGPLEGSHFWPISVCADDAIYLYFGFLFRI